MVAKPQATAASKPMVHTITQFLNAIYAPNNKQLHPLNSQYHSFS